MAARCQQNGGSFYDHCPAWWGKGFYEYYQIVQLDKSSGEEDGGDEESESERKRELKGRTEGLHSPWGTIWSIASATGWTVDYILWGISWPNVQMMIADAPRYTTEPKKKEITTAEEARKFFKV